MNARGWSHALSFLAGILFTLLIIVVDRHLRPPATSHVVHYVATERPPDAGPNVPHEGEPESPARGASIDLTASVPNTSPPSHTDDDLAASSGIEQPPDPGSPDPKNPGSPDLKVGPPVALPAPSPVGASAGASISATTEVRNAPEPTIPPSPESADELIVELRAGRLGRRTVPALTQNGEVMIPLDELFDLVEVRAEHDSSGWFRAVREPEHIEIRINQDSGMVWMADERMPGGDLLTQGPDGATYLDAALVAVLLDTDVSFDPTEMTVLLHPVDHLPIGLRVAREEARQRLLARSSRRRPDSVHGGEFVGLQGAAIDWSLGVPEIGDPSLSYYRVALGTNVLTGVLNVTYFGRRSAGTSQATDQIDASWVGAWPENRWVRQLSLGSIQGTGPRPSTIRGFAVSNSPFTRSAHFGHVLLSGRLDPDWEVELHQEGELADFARADDLGYYALDAAVNYGQNPVEVRGYGPNGEMRVLSRALRVDHDRLPEGRFEYGISGGEHRFGNSAARGNADLAYGLNRNWTLRGGVDRFERDGPPNLTHAYGILTGSIPLARLQIRVEGVARALAGMQIGYEPSPDLRASFSHHVYSTSIGQPILHPAGFRNRNSGSLFWRPNRSIRGLFLTFDAARITESNGWQTGGIAQFSAHVSNVHWTAHWREAHTRRFGWYTRTTSIGLSGTTTLHARREKLLDNLLLQASVSADPQSQTLTGVSVVLAKSLGKWARLEIGSSWRNGIDEPTLSVRITTNGAAFRSTSQIARSPAGDVSTSTFAQGSLVWNDAVGRLEPFPYQSTGRGGLSGRVFVDANGDGWRDPGEIPVDGLRLRTRTSSVVTDSHGRYSLWNLTPFEATELEPDPSTLRDPLLVPHFELASVKILPNGFREINLPMVRGTEVLGRIVDEIGKTPEGAGGLRVSLRHLSSNKVRETTTFRDGVFYFMALAPGSYDLTIHPTDLARLGVRLDSASSRCNVPLSTDLTGQAYQFEVRLVE